MRALTSSVDLADGRIRLDLWLTVSVAPDATDRSSLISMQPCPVTAKRDQEGQWRRAILEVYVIPAHTPLTWPLLTCGLLTLAAHRHISSFLEQQELLNKFVNIPIQNTVYIRGLVFGPRVFH